MSGYPPSGYGSAPYGAPGGYPPQPYAPSPYGAPQNPSPYGAPQTSSPYGAPPAAAPYSAPAPYGAPPASAPYGAAAPYGAPSAPYAQGEKPPKGDKPPKQQGDAYGAGHGGGYPSPFAALVPSQFPPGTDPNLVAGFRAADQDGSGVIDDKELQRALSSFSQTFSMRTVHLLMYLFTNSNSRKIGPKEFTSVFYSLQNWRAIFERFDRDRSGKIDASELRDALLSLGYSASPVILDLLITKFDKTGSSNKAIEYDNFIECCLTVKGLTEKFKEKDTMFNGSASFTYETFMLTVLPFLIA